MLVVASSAGYGATEVGPIAHNGSVNPNVEVGADCMMWTCTHVCVASDTVPGCLWRWGLCHVSSWAMMKEWVTIKTRYTYYMKRHDLSGRSLMLLTWSILFLFRVPECHRMSDKVTGSRVLCWWRDGTHETSVVKNRRKHWRDPSPMQERAKHDCMAAWIFWMCIESTEEQAWYAIYVGEKWGKLKRIP